MANDSPPAPFPFPYSLMVLPGGMRGGLLVISVLSILSLGSTLGLLMFMVYRLIYSSNYYSSPLRFNQSIILILNLLLADLQQALSFSLSLHWVINNHIIAPSSTCSAQAWLVQMGDLTSGLFSLAIALHTFIGVVFGYKFRYRAFVCIVCGIWAFSLSLSLVGPIKYQRTFFVRAGAWCWISSDYGDERLYVHYIWIFICEFASLTCYIILFFILQRRVKLNAVGGIDNRALQRVARYMLVYPVAYTCLTLPLAAGRMAAINSGRELSNTFLIVAGAFMTSSGWVDVILYTVTRRTIVFTPHGRSTEISLSTLPYGTTTTVSKAPRNRRDSEGGSSAACSQENIVKMERMVEVNIETAETDSSAEHENSLNIARGLTQAW